MPYVKPQRRKELDAGDPPKNGGDLNYLFTMLILTGKRVPPAAFTSIIDDFWKRSEQRYSVINEIGGAVINCAMEFQSRVKTNVYRAGLQALGTAYMEWYGAVARPYEDTKIQENGDIFP